MNTRKRRGPQASAGKASPLIRLTIGNAVPARDGVRLRANLYLPAQGERFTTVVQLTPYTADSIHAWASYFAQQGFAFLALNCRGRGGSEGSFKPFHGDGKDGRDAVEWAARQPWSDGRIVMSGGSYAGFTQWATAVTRPPHLVAIAPIASVYPGWDFPRQGGILATYVARWLAFVEGAVSNEAHWSDAALWKSRARAALIGHRSLLDTAGLHPTGDAMLAEWLAHPDNDEYWKALAIRPQQYRALRIPIFTICGQYDGDQPGALRYYAEHRLHAANRGAAHDLLLGPWDHPGTREPKRAFGGLQFGPKSEVNVKQLLCDWYRWALREGQRPALLKAPVTLYVAGDERWRYHSRPESAATPGLRFFGEAARTDAGSVRRAGTLAKRRPSPHVRRFSRDPRDIREALIALEVKNGFSDPRYSRAIDGTGLVFETSPVRRGILVMGRPRLSAWLRLDTPDADLSASLEELRQDGHVISLGDWRLRARYRKSLARQELVQLGTWRRYDLPGFYYIARRLARGSRLRLVFTSPVSAFLERNPNTGKPMHADSPADGRRVTIDVQLGGPRGMSLRFDQIGE